MIRLTSWCTFVALLMVLTCSAMAQSQSNADTPGMDSGAVATGVNFVRPGEWSQLRTVVRNPTSDDVHVVVTNTFGKASNVQFATPLWLPANSRRVIDLPARVLDDEQVKPRSGLLIQSMLLSQTAKGREKSWLSRETGQALVEGNSLNISILGNSADEIFDLVSKMRVDMEGQKGIRIVHEDTAPYTVLAWEPLAALVISGTPDLDARQIDALRGWILNGGRVWLMLDDVDTAFISRLLGDLWDVTTVDHTRLQRVVFGHTKQAGDVYDVPVNFVHTLPGSAKVLSRLGQWPAAMTIDAGQGQVIVTTLGAVAWMTKQANPYFEQIGKHLFVRQPSEVPRLEAASALAASSIGRQIVSRTVVLVVLVVMVLLMLGAGVLCYRRGHLEWMGAVAPGLAVLTALMLLGIGKSKQGQVPLTISAVNIVHVSPQLGVGMVRGSAAIYSPSTEDSPLQATRGGMLWPNMSGLRGRVVRLVMSDMNQWKWQGVEFSSGAIRTGALQQQVQFDDNMAVQGMFGPQGLEITTNSKTLNSMHDRLLAMPGGVMSIHPEPSSDDASQNGDQTIRRYVAGLEDVLDRGQYLKSGGAILTGDQQQRQSFYASIYKTKDGLPQRASLIGWLENLDTGLTLSDEHEERNSSLLMVPLTMQRPPVGQEVMIPSTFMSFDVVKVPGERTSATVYNRTTGEWISVTNPTRVALAFKLPESVLPLEIEKATFTLSIRAPGRTVDLFTRQGLRGEPAYSAKNPNGKMVFEFDQKNKLKADAQGNVLVIVRVGDTDTSQLWDISDVKLQVQGKVLSARGSDMHR